MPTYAVVSTVTGLVMNIVVASPGDKIPGVVLAPVPARAAVTIQHRWNGSVFIAPDRYGAVFGRRLEKIITVPNGNPTPTAPVGSQIVLIPLGAIVTEFRTTHSTQTGFVSVPFGAPNPSR